MYWHDVNACLNALGQVFFILFTMVNNIVVHKSESQFSEAKHTRPSKLWTSRGHYRTNGKTTGLWEDV